MLGLEHDLVTRRRAPGSTAPPLRWKGRGPATPDATTHKDLEVSERYSAALLPPDRAEREDRIERSVAIHAYMRRAIGVGHVSRSFRSMADDNARVVPAHLRRR